VKAFAAAFFILLIFDIQAQELYVSTEPASNMPAKSIGLRLNNYLMPPYQNSKFGVKNNEFMYRFNPEIMWGISKHYMLHINMYASNMHQEYLKFEGASLYLKYRFLSMDHSHKHFRMAAYLKSSLINNKIQYHDLNLSGDNSGIGVGIVATQLLNKLAVSFTGGYIKAINNINNDLVSGQPTQAFNYSLSSGYLVLPIKYKNYNQPNFNLYAEFLGKYNPETEEHFIDFAPALQVIIKSKMRVDFAYRRQIAGTMLRINNQEFILKFEYNFFNAYKGKS